jgi:L-ascorbate metabolism protein UlaG (beta-lactamase superfamily)
LLFGLIRLEKDNVGFARGSIGFKIFLEDKTFVNLGDSLLLNEWKDLRPDVLMIPVGGKTVKNTMNENEALEAIKIIKPKTVIPCHYKVDFLWKKNIILADLVFLKKKVESLGIRFNIMEYGDEIDI